MKKDKKEIVRMQTILESDRMKTGDSFFELVSSDVGEVLSDYFDFCGEPKIIMDKLGDRYKVEITILASRIKNFDSVPKN